MWTMTRILLAALLTATAAMKVSGAAAILGSDGLLASPVALSLVVALELFAAIFIAFSPGWFARRFALLLFSALAFIAAWAWYRDQSCGCFGAQTPKGVPLLIDILAISFVLWSMKAETKKDEGQKQGRLSLRVSVAVGLVTAVMAGGFAAVSSSARLPRLPSIFRRMASIEPQRTANAVGHWRLDLAKQMDGNAGCRFGRPYHHPRCF